MRNRSIMLKFKWTRTGKLTFSHRQHMKKQTQWAYPLLLWIKYSIWRCSAKIVRWVSKSMRPLSIVEDKGFHILMKTGRPEYYIPLPRTVAQDVKQVFKNMHHQISKILQVSSSFMSLSIEINISYRSILGHWILQRMLGLHLCHNYHTFWARWCPYLPSSWCCWSGVFPYWHQSCKCLCRHFEGLQNWR